MSYRILSGLMIMVIKGLAGVILGVLYGILIGALTAVLWRLAHDPAYPGAMIPDNNGWGRPGFCDGRSGWLWNPRGTNCESVRC